MMAGSIAPEASTGGFDVVSQMAASTEQLLQTVERSWASGTQQTDSLAEAVQNGRKVLEHVRQSKSKSPLRKTQELEPAAVPIPPIHYTISESDTEMDDEATQAAGQKRPVDMADDLHKAIEEARKVLPDLPMSAEAHDAASRRRPRSLLDNSQIVVARWRACRTTRRCRRDGLPERIRCHVRHLRAPAGRNCSATSTRSTPGRVRNLAGCVAG